MEDYDSSFDYIDDVEKLELQNLSLNDDTISDSFEFYNGKEVEMPKEDLLDAPITTSILGKWKLIHSEDLPAYIQAQKLQELQALAWEHGNLLFDQELHNNQIHIIAHTELFGKAVQKFIMIVGQSGTSENWTYINKVEENCLMTVCYADCMEAWRVDRRIVDGKLVIENRKGATMCRRVYERVV